jgi:hypothetical protein
MFWALIVSPKNQGHGKTVRAGSCRNKSRAYTFPPRNRSYRFIRDSQSAQGVTIRNFRALHRLLVGENSYKRAALSK